MRLFRGDLWEVFEPEDVGEAEEGEPGGDDHEPLAGVGRPVMEVTLSKDRNGITLQHVKIVIQ